MPAAVPPFVDPRILAIIQDPAAPSAVPPATPLPRSLPGAVGLFANARNVLGLGRHGAAHVRTLQQRYGDIYRISQGRNDLVCVWDLAEVQTILRNEDSAWSTGMGWDAYLFGRVNPGRGNSGVVVSLDFEPHRVARRALQPAFSARSLKGYIELAQPLMQETVASWLARGEVSFRSEVRTLLADVANTIFTGIEDRDERARLDRGLRAVWSAALAPTDRAWLSGALRRGRREWRAMCGHFHELLPTRMRQPGRDMFSQLVIAREPDSSTLTFVQGFVGMMLAAYDTTAVAVTSMAYLLAKHPEWQERLREELAQVDSDALELASLQQLTQLDWVWKESLRLMPVTGFLPRVNLREVRVSGHTLPAGAMVGLVLGPNGRLARHWHEPNRFDPERFARGEDRKPGLFMPFGAGPHACLGTQLAGIEAKLLFHRLLTRCRLSLTRDYEARHTYSPLGCVSGDVALTLTRL